MLAGEEKSWEDLRRLDPEQVARRSGARVEESGAGYHLEVLGHSFLADPHKRQISETGGHHFHARELTHFTLLVPLYLSSCAGTELSGRLLAPASLPHGRSFFTGRYELPVEAIAHHFGSNPDNFEAAGRKLGGSRVDFGDVAIALPVFPRLPVTMILWVGDLEFPARVQMLIDETASAHLPLDALWASMVMASQALRQAGGPHH